MSKIEKLEFKPLPLSGTIHTAGIKDKLIEKINEVIDTLNSLTAKEKWKPKGGDDYFFINNFSSVCCPWDSDDTDLKRYELGNCFPTRELAEQALERIKLALKGE